MNIPQRKWVVLFDGVCGLCNRTVDWLMSRDKRGLLCFAPLQGITAQGVCSRHKIIALEGPSEAGTTSPTEAQRVSKNPGTLVLVKNLGAEREKIYTRSGAAIRAIALTGGIRRLTLAALVVPWFMRDWFYNFVARRRYKWFGALDACRLPKPGEREKFLD